MFGVSSTTVVSTATAVVSAISVVVFFFSTRSDCSKSTNALIVLLIS
jgi:hypothetical protein